MKSIEIYDIKNIDTQTSKEWAQKFDLRPRECYQNVAEILSSVNISEINISSLEIIYGYYGIPDVQMTRHCFLKYNGKIVDPTSYELACKNRYTYHAFKHFTVNNYIECLLNYYNNKSEEYAPWLEYKLNEEKEYLKFIIKENIPINKFAYDNFLEKYDTEKKVAVVNIQ